MYIFLLKNKYFFLTGLGIFIFGWFIISQNKWENFFAAKISPELNIASYSYFGNGKGKVVAASCSFSDYPRNTLPIIGTGQGHGREFTRCDKIICGTTILRYPGYRQCGGQCLPYNQVSTSSSPYICSVFCPAGIVPNVAYAGSSQIEGNTYYYPENGRPAPRYNLGNCNEYLRDFPASVRNNWPPTNIVRRCQINRNTSDDSDDQIISDDNYDEARTTWGRQSSRVYPYREFLSVRCGYFNTASSTYVYRPPAVVAIARISHPDTQNTCSTTDVCGVVKNGTYNDEGICEVDNTVYPPCTNTNLCGQTSSGVLCPGNICKSNPPLNNNSCIASFTASTNVINPNGSVEFSWKINSSSSQALCSFVDLTRANATRTIPGLENFNPADHNDKLRITNIQNTTRFCLVCAFKDKLGNLLGEAAAHQWVKVIRVGEN